MAQERSKSPMTMTLMGAVTPQVIDDVTLSPTSDTRLQGAKRSYPKRNCFVFFLHTNSKTNCPETVEGSGFPAGSLRLPKVQGRQGRQETIAIHLWKQRVLPHLPRATIGKKSLMHV
eukprot:scaffold4974_cov75-Cylindrotheca_fusiformis.AAC.1